MSLWILKQLHQLIKSLHSNESPSQLAAGFVLGSFIGWVPFNVLYSMVFFILLYVLNVNAGFGLLAVAVITLFSFLLDPFAGILGSAVLNTPALKGLWTLLYNLPIIPFTNFNNTVMLGSFLWACILALPLYFLTKWMVIRYRASWKTKVETWKVVRWIQASKAVGWWTKLRNFS